ncbi:hypothetical protein N658DRAFT_569186 [Parathielavia hyrcaniae]|uniref:RBR-type E3 ubiquitin transferase n=1 Tax=Parathielavia hyrcaniae TaxID=113614 RepID=A0AAN6PW13_9PEZI|nr:hypothetical protein N658DRAFT_569186 [Parathielavia hyrcaniae]
MAERSKECVVCAEEKAPEAFPASPPSRSCQHNSRTCSDCISRAIRAHIQARILTDALCPECPGVMSTPTILRHTDAETLQRYHELCLQRLMQEEENFVWCAAGCGSGQIHEGGSDQPIVKCAGCGSKTCFSCKVPWHVDVTCAEWASFMAPTSDKTAKEPPRSAAEIFNEQAKELRASTEIIHKTTKPCPNCRWNIEKNGGCNLHIPILSAGPETVNVAQAPPA